MAGQSNPVSISLKWEREVSRCDFENVQKNRKFIGTSDRWLHLPPSLFLLHRLIEQQYQQLPWPAKIKKISILTEEVGGLGDISAAAKVITVMQNMCPDLELDWYVKTAHRDLESFLTCPDPSKVTIRTPASPKEAVTAEMLVVGPALTACYNEGNFDSMFKIQLKGPRFDFLESASRERSEGIVPTAICMAKTTSDDLGKLNPYYRSIHKVLFPVQNSIYRELVMGLRKGSGILLDEERMNALLSREYCCPQYLLQLEDQGLQIDILSSMTKGMDYGSCLPDYDRYSFNSGYAHKRTSWAKFIDFVALHEKEKDVVIVLNQKGVFDDLFSREFSELILTQERIDFLEELGYGIVNIKAGKEPSVLKQSSKDNLRTLTIILRRSFTPNDMKWMQLASERLMATGDNTPAEAWASRCKLYLYEFVANGGCKGEFLKQQIDVANTISPDLGTLLTVFGDSFSAYQLALHKTPCELLSKQELEQVVPILNKPTLAKDTLKFCRHITQNYGFNKVLEGALKRVAWHQCIPQLMVKEADALDEEYKLGLVRFLNGDEHSSTLVIQNLPILAKSIDLKVREYLNKLPS